MNPKNAQIIIQILRIGISAPVGYYLGKRLQWENFMLIGLYFGVYMVVSLLIEIIRNNIASIFQNRKIKHK